MFNQQFVVYDYQFDLCNAEYISYTSQHSIKILMKTAGAILLLNQLSYEATEDHSFTWFHICSSTYISLFIFIEYTTDVYITLEFQ